MRLVTPKKRIPELVYIGKRGIAERPLRELDLTE